jgi:hypothetical protein
MKACLLILLAVAPAVRAQVVECPKFYPWQDTVLAEVPYGHKGKGMVTKERLTGAGLTVGEFNGGGDMQGLRKNVKGGHEVDYGTIDGATGQQEGRLPAAGAGEEYERDDGCDVDLQVGGLPVSPCSIRRLQPALPSLYPRGWRRSATPFCRKCRVAS